MSSRISPKSLFIASGALLLLCLANRHQPKGGDAPFSYPEPEIEKVEYREEPKPEKQWYKYRVEIETTPENQVYQIEKSGYQQYEVSRLGESYSYTVWEFTSDKVMTTEEAYEFVRKHPEKCTRVSPNTQKDITEQFDENYDNYIDDPEDIESYPDEIFDFLMD